MTHPDPIRALMSGDFDAISAAAGLPRPTCDGPRPVNDTATARETGPGQAFGLSAPVSDPPTITARQNGPNGLGGDGALVVNRDYDGGLNELFATAARVHLKAMNDAAWRIGITFPSGHVVRVNLGVRWADPDREDPDADDLARFGLVPYATEHIWHQAGRGNTPVDPALRVLAQEGRDRWHAERRAEREARP